MTRLRALLILLGLMAATLVAVQAPAQAAAPRAWKSVSAGSGHTCAIRDNQAKNLYCWGDNSARQLGVTIAGGGDASRPVKVGSGSWRSVSAGTLHTCGITLKKRLYCWGTGSGGRLGTGDTSNRNRPTKIGTKQWSTVVAGAQNTCGITTDRTLYCWGDSYYGQIGDGEKKTRKAPRRVGTRRDWATVVAGYTSTCAINRSEKLYCWGDNQYGQLGIDEPPTEVLTATRPRRVGSEHDWKRLSGSYATTCGVRQGGRAFCWGYNPGGEAGTGSPGVVQKPTLVRGGKRFTSIASAGGMSCGVRTSSHLYCWGFGGDGRLGTGSSDNQPYPTEESRGRSGWRTVTAGGGHGCAIRSGGKLYCWGNNPDGQLGAGSIGGHKNYPVRVS